VEASSVPYTQFGDSLQWEFASLAANETLLLTVDLRVPDTFAVGTSIESTFSVTSDQVEQPVIHSATPVMVLSARLFAPDLLRTYALRMFQLR
jgi:hypothetical protein